MSTLKTNFCVITNVSEKSKDEKRNFVPEGFKKDVVAFANNSEKFRNDKKVVTEAIEQVGLLFQGVSKELQKIYAIVNLGAFSNHKSNSPCDQIKLSRLGA